MNSGVHKYMAKERKIKLDVPKRKRFTAKEIAEVTGVGEGYVKKIRSGHAEVNSDTAKRVQAIDNMLNNNANRLLEEIAKVLDQEKSTAA